MIPVPTQTTANGTVRVWLATGHTDMRKGFSSLAVLVQDLSIRRSKLNQT